MHGEVGGGPGYRLGRVTGAEEAGAPARGRWVWVDLENTPHVLFLGPFVRRLKAEGVDVVVTAKPQSQTVALAAKLGLAVRVVGDGDLASWGAKVTGAFGRAAALARWLRGQPRRPAVLLHSSRTAALAARALGIPGVGMLDYEKAVHWPMALGSRSLWFPDVLRGVALPWLTRRVARFYPGLKENLYLDPWDGDRQAIRAALGVGAATLVVARPPADTAHYARGASARWWEAAVDAMAARGARVIVVPRGDRQGAAMAHRFSATPGIAVERTVVDGPELVAAADLVIGGGGTMNREAAVLGIMAWSTFAGPRPHVDEVLASEGRLRWVHSGRDLADALATLGPPPAPRRPHPEGLACILTDLRRYL